MYIYRRNYLNNILLPSLPLFMPITFQDPRVHSGPRRQHPSRRKHLLAYSAAACKYRTHTHTHTHNLFVGDLRQSVIDHCEGRLPTVDYVVDRRPSILLIVWQVWEMIHAATKESKLLATGHIAPSAKHITPGGEANTQGAARVGKVSSPARLSASTTYPLASTTCPLTSTAYPLTSTTYPLTSALTLGAGPPCEPCLCGCEGGQEQRGGVQPLGA
eukprot:644799-Pyramimonas_sp.AAC.2